VKLVIREDRLALEVLEDRLDPEVQEDRLDLQPQRVLLLPSRPFLRARLLLLARL